MWSARRRRAGRCQRSEFLVDRGLNVGDRRAHQPRFNVKLRDDKQYLVLRLVDPKPPADGARRSATCSRASRSCATSATTARTTSARTTRRRRARETLRTLNRHFQLRTCTDHVLETRGRPCLQYQIKRCSGPCAIDVAAGGVRRAGRGREDVPRRQERRARAAPARAHGARAPSARTSRSPRCCATRSPPSSARSRSSTSCRTTSSIRTCGACIARPTAVEVVVLFVRAGKLVGRRAFQQKDQELPDAAVIAEHLQQYYATGTFIPDEVVVGVELEDADVLADWLGSRARQEGARSSSRGAACARGSSSSPIATRPRRRRRARARTTTPRRCSRRSRSASACRGRRAASSASTSRTSRAPTRSRRW